MPKKKEQHFVPRFYLKRFSLDENRINLHIIEKKKTILSGKLKTQCSKNYFYGKNPVIEDALSKLESDSSNVIRKIVNENKVPKRFTVEHFTLFAFVLFQHSRTKNASEQIEEGTEKFFDLFLKEKISQDSDIPVDELDNLTLGYEFPALVSLGHAAIYFPIFTDLQVKIVRNHSDIEFITSDNPVVIYNQYAFGKKVGSTTGLAVKGLQVFYPIDPFTILVFYDPKIYKVATRKSDFTITNNKDDIDQMNTLQFLNAFETIYFHSSKMNSYIESMNNHYSSKRKINKVIFKNIPHISDRKKELIHTYRPDIPYKINPTFIKFLKGKRNEEFKNLGVEYRQPEIVELYNVFFEEVNIGNYTHGDFHKFLNDLESRQSMLLKSSNS